MIDLFEEKIYDWSTERKDTVKLYLLKGSKLGLASMYLGMVVPPICIWACVSLKDLL